MSKQVPRLYVTGYGVSANLIHLEPLAEAAADTWADEPNPRGLPIYGHVGDDAPGHLCRPRVIGHCHRCVRDFNLCLPTRAEVMALRQDIWSCNDCGGGTR